ncbi:MAG: hypothetical protein HQ596_01930 [Candidatus Saganbacteria bacterium]|nr:hypothetical protein [Candidatus Saganbacteria bacterium]
MLKLKLIAFNIRESYVEGEIANVEELILRAQSHAEVTTEDVRLAGVPAVKRHIDEAISQGTIVKFLTPFLPPKKDPKAIETLMKEVISSFSEGPKRLHLSKYVGRGAFRFAAFSQLGIGSRQDLKQIANFLTDGRLLALARDPQTASFTLPVSGYFVRFEAESIHVRISGADLMNGAAPFIKIETLKVENGGETVDLFVDHPE